MSKAKGIVPPPFQQSMHKPVQKRRIFTPFSFIALPLFSLSIATFASAAFFSFQTVEVKMDSVSWIKNIEINAQSLEWDSIVLAKAEPEKVKVLREVKKTSFLRHISQKRIARKTKIKKSLMVEPLIAVEVPESEKLLKAFLHLQKNFHLAAAAFDNPIVKNDQILENSAVATSNNVTTHGVSLINVRSQRDEAHAVRYLPVERDETKPSEYSVITQKIERAFKKTKRIEHAKQIRQKKTIDFILAETKRTAEESAKNETRKELAAAIEPQLANAIAQNTQNETDGFEPLAPFQGRTTLAMNTQDTQSAPVVVLPKDEITHTQASGIVMNSAPAISVRAQEVLTTQAGYSAPTARTTSPTVTEPSLVAPVDKKIAPPTVQKHESKLMNVSQVDLPAPYCELLNCDAVNFDEVDSEESHAEWKKLDVAGFWSVLFHEETHEKRKTPIAISFPSKNLIRAAALKADIALSDSLGVVYGKVQAGWSVRLPSSDSAPLYVSQQNGFIAETENKEERVFVFINVKPGASVAYLTHEQTGAKTAISFPVLEQTATLLETDKLTYTDLKLNLYSAQSAKPEPITGALVKVIGFSEMNRITDSHGSASFKNILLAGEYPVFVDIESQNEFTHRFGLSQQSMRTPKKSIMPILEENLFVFSQKQVQHWLKSLKANPNDTSALMVAAVPELLKRLETRTEAIEQLHATVTSQKSASLMPEVYALDLSGKPQYEYPLYFDQPRFLASQISEGVAETRIYDGSGNEVWAKWFPASPGVINVIRD